MQFLTQNIFRFSFFILTACFFLVSKSAFAETPEQGFSKTIEEVLSNSCLRRNKFGIQIVSLKDNSSLFSQNSSRQYIPASNMKLLTSAAALRVLGPDYQFVTSLYSPGRIKGDVLSGDLYIKGSGDPKLVTEQLWRMALQVRNLPLTRIAGDIVADESFFDDRQRGRFGKALAGIEAYNAPLGALSFNFNTVEVLVSPAKTVGKPPVVVVEPDVGYVRVDNRAKTLAFGKRGRLIVNRFPGEGYDTITITGSVSKDRARSHYFVNITNPPLYAAMVFKDYLRRAGVVVDGTARRGVTPLLALEVTDFTSEPLSLALRGLNKFSNNFLAEQILKTMGAHVAGNPGTTKKGLAVIKKYLNSLGFDSSQFRIFDGSGLSRRNEISADLVVAVLKDMEGDWGVFPEFLDSLAVMGVDGSVQDRLAQTEEARRIRVKTGTLNFTSSLSGYVQSADGEHFAFSILMNDLKCSNGRAKKIQDRIVKELLNFKRGTKTSNLADHSESEE